MATLAKDQAERFAGLCHNAERSWTVWRALHEGVPQQADFSKGMSRDARIAFDRVVLQACQDHALMQIAKLHDPAASKGNVTLGLDYVLQCDNWKMDVRDGLKGLKKELDTLATTLRKKLRNKLIAHNDLAAVMVDDTVVIFDHGEDVHYFNRLWEFVDIVHREVNEGGLLRSEEFKKCGDALAKWIRGER